MARRVLERFAATADVVRATCIARLDAIPDADGILQAPVSGVPGTWVLVIDVRDTGEGSTVELGARGALDIPFWGWAFRGLNEIALRRRYRHALEVLRHDLEGGPEPRHPRGVVGLPPVDFAPEQAALLATAALAVAIVSFASALFGQLADPISETFRASDATLGVALALTRIGAMIALVVTALADHRGRRHSILIGVTGTAAACAVSALAPTLAVFTVAQTFQRGFVITTATVAGIAVIEEAPEGARAYAATMLALAGGFGFSFAVLALLVADVGDDGWRIAYGLGALTIVMTPRLARHLVEGRRYEHIAARADIARGRIRVLLDSRYGRRFVLLALIGFMTNVFNAPSSQLMNKYLSDDRGFSNAGITLFRTVTTAAPGLIGLLIGGRLAERRGRKPVALVGLLIATVTQMIFFLQGGVSLWVMSAVSVLTSAAGGVALGTMDVELFPTELRGTSNALLSLVTVGGSVSGLVLAGTLSDPVGGLGKAIALCGIGTLLALLFVLPHLPEPGSHGLDDISPSG